MWFRRSRGLLHLESPGAASVYDLRSVQGRVRNVDGNPDAMPDERAGCRLKRRHLNTNSLLGVRVLTRRRLSDKNTEGGPMVCQRCRGLIVRETSSDLREKTGYVCQATRCINCGFIEDSVVRANRLRPPAAKRAAPRRMARKERLLFLTARSESYRS